MSDAAEKIQQAVGARAVEIGDALKMRVGREVQRIAADVGAELDDFFKGLIDEINGDVGAAAEEEEQ